MDAEDAAAAKADALAVEEAPEIELLFQRIRRLSPTARSKRLKMILRSLKQDGYGQVMIFTR